MQAAAAVTGGSVVADDPTDGPTGSVADGPSAPGVVPAVASCPVPAIGRARMSTPAPAPTPVGAVAVGIGGGGGVGVAVGCSAGEVGVDATPGT